MHVILLTLLTLLGFAPPPKITVRPATAAGDTVWVKTTYSLPNSFPAGDSVQVDYYRGGALASVSRRTRAAVDSLQLPTLVLPGETQTFAVCTKTVRGLLAAGEKCSNTVSWTRPVTAPTPVIPAITTLATGTPAITVQGVGLDSVIVRAGYAPVPTTWGPDDSVSVFYKRSGSVAVTTHVRVSPDSATVAVTVAAGASQSFQVCTAVKRYVNNAITGEGVTKCSTTSSYTRPLPPPDTTGTPTIILSAFFPTSVNAAAMTPACQTKLATGTPWINAAKGTPITECVDNSGRPMVVQFCSYAKWSDGVWSHVSNTASAARCQFLDDSIPMLQPFSTTRVVTVKTLRALRLPVLAIR